MTILFSPHQSAELAAFLFDPEQQRFITNALMQSVRGEPGQHRCHNKQVQDRIRGKESALRHLLICGYCNTGVVRLFDRFSDRARVPECSKCGARVVGIEVDFKPWNEWRIKQLYQWLGQQVTTGGGSDRT